MSSSASRFQLTRSKTVGPKWSKFGIEPIIDLTDEPDFVDLTLATDGDMDIVEGYLTPDNFIQQVMSNPVTYIERVWLRRNRASFLVATHRGQLVTLNRTHKAIFDIILNFMPQMPIESEKRKSKMTNRLTYDSPGKVQELNAQRDSKGAVLERFDSIDNRM